MKLSKQVRIGNLLEWNGKPIVLSLESLRQQVIEEESGDSHLTPIPITKEWLLKFGFLEKENEMYINGYQYILQVKGHHDDISKEGIDKDGTWFDGIGLNSWKETKHLAVNVLCRGNYVCNGAYHVHELQNLYFSLTGKELEQVNL